MDPGHWFYVKELRLKSELIFVSRAATYPYLIILKLGGYW